jgi:2-dehydro-3-deoxyphosphooctonate aldolase (KDO 8-P synthase)
MEPNPATAVRLLVIAGPCVIEDEALTVDIARRLQSICEPLDVDLVFKASFDKANRTSASAYRGPGLEEGLRMLARVREETGVPVLSDIHEPWQAEPAAEALDILQIPAYLCRQTDLVLAAARTMKPLNIKKAQFMAPEDMQYVVEKAATTGNRRLYLTERGTTFGYHNLVVDFRALTILRGLGYPVVFDATHAVQVPSKGGLSAGHREYVAPLARAAAAYGIDGLFCEVHPDPPRARSDAANSLYLDTVPALLESVLAVRTAAGFG